LIPHHNQPLLEDPGWFLLGTHSGPSYTDCQSVLHSSACFVRPAGRARLLAAVDSLRAHQRGPAPSCSGTASIPVTAILSCNYDRPISPSHWFCV